MEWYLKVFQQYAVFSGRARRKEYWMFTLFHMLAFIALAVVEGIIGLPGILSGLYVLASFIPTLAVTIRRLHDTERSGWWILVSLIPLVGTLVLLFFMVQDSKEKNNWGENPKLSAAA
ncbi:DUF805 domain-containing protein [Parendozoicomonas haliclonae]|uniref:Inner membrane protein YhaI n=1 Tax=Parendozoicomonas haliclonae TaxID=1960125 RepID=A0A1X7ALJ1_9GAMM|nr:DUF805 domain-containing protein [Parendozoicomonas haliclonae]SMA48237.1 Inner membrane protein YhaI [Parendozoicomonas haliclonae]